MTSDVKIGLGDLPLDIPELPDGWKYERFASLLVDEKALTYGIVQPGHHDSRGVPIVRVHDIKNGIIQTDEPLRVSAEIAANYQRTKNFRGQTTKKFVEADQPSSILSGLSPKK